MARINEKIKIEERIKNQKHYKMGKKKSFYNVISIEFLFVLFRTHGHKLLLKIDQHKKNN